jgi:Reverse transcriptase (RNA-dependent DNA polymerase)/Endonuclease-reverse transcriptase
LVSATSEPYHKVARHLQTALAGRVAVVEVNGVTLISAYLPPAPTVADTCIDELLTLADEVIQNGANKCVVVGDLNARSRALTGDSTDNSRGRRLAAALAGSELRVQKPIAGKWTCKNRGGAGIPDMVLANFPIRDLVVHEDWTCGGSDHHPLTFTAHDTPLRQKNIRRWNIRRLGKDEVSDRYKERLKELVAEATVEEESVKARELVGCGALVGDEIQAVVDKQWAQIKRCIDSAAASTVGKLRWDSRVAPNFWTEELEEQREEADRALRDAQEAMMEGQESTEEVGRRFDHSTNHMRDYRAALRRRGTELFRRWADDIGQPKKSAAFMRMVKGARKRQTGGGCALNPDMVDTYVDHFQSTFGGIPTGIPLSRGEWATAVEPASELDAESIVSKSTVRTKVKSLPRGKAWGADEVPAEFLIEGLDALTDVLVAFLRLVFDSECIPTIWRAALVVPIWKKKGDDKDIANYRPISLTCTGRRLYERIILADVDRFVHHLADSQGGFRPHRGCEHQALVLHEAFISNANPRVALLDLRAAYDLADRSRLWEMLAVHYGFPPASVRRLADLFDHNVSKLVVGGKTSKALPNKRGVLQGSSLSPALFNFLINELALKLEAQPGGLRVYRKLVRALLFADDTALLAATDTQLAVLLQVCEEWSQQAGMEFSPAKCVVFAPPPAQRLTPLRIYGTDLPSTVEAPYLGFPFTFNGIDFTALCNQRCEKARGVIAAMRSMGMNATGWAPAAARQAYLTFIRPAMEYGVALRRPSHTLLVKYQQTQTLALRTILSATTNTSVAALHRLLCIPTFDKRAEELNFLLAARFHNNNDATVPGVQVWRRALELTEDRKTPKGALPQATMLHNPTVRALRSSFMNHTAVPLTRGPPTEPKPVIQPPPRNKTQRKQQRVEDLQKLESEKDGIAASVRVRADGRPHKLLWATTEVSREDRVSITRWQLGMVASHQTCKKCGAHNGLSREHAVECAKVETILATELAGIPEGVKANIRGHTVIDILINEAAMGMSKERAALLVSAIDTIEVQCRGRVRTEMGFWKAPAPD